MLHHLFFSFFTASEPNAGSSIEMAGGLLLAHLGKTPRESYDGFDFVLLMYATNVRACPPSGEFVHHDTHVCIVIHQRCPWRGGSQMLGAVSNEKGPPIALRLTFGLPQYTYPPNTVVRDSSESAISVTLWHAAITRAVFDD